MDNHGLLFIPDISGFTNFINKTEIDHSTFIIQELLEILINSNNLDLKVSEIEGDAILFYKFGKAPSMDEIYGQVEAMFCNFHKRIRDYSERRMCPCKACEGTKDLTLKVIAHLGEFSTYTVKEFSKLIGKDVILAHQLLKNDIPLHEYLLVTDDLFEKEGGKLPDWMAWQEGKKQADDDEIGYKYSLLTPLRDNLPYDEPQFGISGKRSEMFSIGMDVDTDMDTAFGTVVDLSIRPEWMEGVTAIRDVSHTLPQVGTSHNCVVGKSTQQIFSSDFKRDDHTVIIEESGKARNYSCQIKLEKLSEHKTRITFTMFLKDSPIPKLMFNLFWKKKMMKQITKSIDNLEKRLTQKAQAA